MATPAHVDVLLDNAQLAREDALGVVFEAQHALHNGLVALRAAWDSLAKVEHALAGDDERGAPGELFCSLAVLRDCPAIRRARTETAAAVWL